MNSLQQFNVTGGLGKTLLGNLQILSSEYKVGRPWYSHALAVMCLSSWGLISPAQCPHAISFQEASASESIYKEETDWHVSANPSCFVLSPTAFTNCPFWRADCKLFWLRFLAVACGASLGKQASHRGVECNQDFPGVSFWKGRGVITSTLIKTQNRLSRKSYRHRSTTSLQPSVHTPNRASDSACSSQASSNPKVPTARGSELERQLPTLDSAEQAAYDSVKTGGTIENQKTNSTLPVPFKGSLKRIPCLFVAGKVCIWAAGHVAYHGWPCQDPKTPGEAEPTPRLHYHIIVIL